MASIPIGEQLVAALNALKPGAEFCLFSPNWQFFCMTKGEWAGWVQALGAIIGIGIAIYLPYATNRNTSRQEVKDRLIAARYWFLRNEPVIESIKTVVRVVVEEVKKDGANLDQVNLSVDLFKDNFSQIVSPKLEELQKFETLSYRGESGVESVGLELYQAYASFLNAVNTQLIWLEKIKSGNYGVPITVKGEPEQEPILKKMVLVNLNSFANTFYAKAENFKKYINGDQLPIGLERGFSWSFTLFVLKISIQWRR